MSAFDELARDPREGDEATLIGGQVSYRVIHFESQTRVYVVRTEIFREAPFARPSESLVMSKEIWFDLVSRAASRVERKGS